MIRITTDTFDVNDMIRQATKPGTGAVVTFLGTVRDDGIDRMDLEAYEEAAESFLREIRDDAMEKYPVASVDIIHRIGSLDVGDDILLIVVAAGHRKEAFAACEYVLERIKERVPIWKKEIGEGGERWVPGHAE